jgi:hypothetical protein
VAQPPTRSAKSKKHITNDAVKYDGSSSKGARNICLCPSTQKGIRIMIGSREKNLETIDFPIKYGVFPYNIYIYNPN